MECKRIGAMQHGDEADGKRKDEHSTCAWNANASVPCNMATRRMESERTSTAPVHGMQTHRCHATWRRGGWKAKGRAQHLCMECKRIGAMQHGDEADGERKDEHSTCAWNANASVPCNMATRRMESERTSTAPVHGMQTHRCHATWRRGGWKAKGRAQHLCMECKRIGAMQHGDEADGKRKDEHSTCAWNANASVPCNMATRRMESERTSTAPVHGMQTHRCHATWRRGGWRAKGRAQHLCMECKRIGAMQHGDEADGKRKDEHSTCAWNANASVPCNMATRRMESERTSTAPVHGMQTHRCHATWRRGGWRAKGRAQHLCMECKRIGAMQHGDEADGKRKDEHSTCAWNANASVPCNMATRRMESERTSTAPVHGMQTHRCHATWRRGGWKAKGRAQHLCMECKRIGAMQHGDEADGKRRDEHSTCAWNANASVPCNMATRRMESEGTSTAPVHGMQTHRCHATWRRGGWKAKGRAQHLCMECKRIGAMQHGDEADGKRRDEHSTCAWNANASV